MKRLIDILVENLSSWPDHIESLWISSYGSRYPENTIFGSTGNHSVEFSGYWDVPCDYKTARVTRAEWQAAVDALNAPKVVEWGGVGNPEPGCSIEYSIGDGWYPCEVRYALNRDDCPGIALVAWCEHLGKDQYLSNDRDHKFRPARTAEQVAAEEREKAIKEICIDAGSPEMTPGQLKVAEKLYQAGYRKQVTK